MPGAGTRYLDGTRFEPSPLSGRPLWVVLLPALLHEGIMRPSGKRLALA